MAWKLAINGIFGWLVSLGEGRARNVGTIRHDGSGRFSPAVLVQSAQEPCHVDRRGFHPVSQGIAVNAGNH